MSTTSEKWPDDKLEREMIADAERVADQSENASASDLCCHIKALLSRIRELEAAFRTEAATA